jgi:hypothetical protein
VLDDRYVTVFALEQREPWIRFRRETGTGYGEVRFSNDGKYVLSTASQTRDLIVALWDPEDLITVACQSFLLDELEKPEVRKACAGKE